MENKKFEPLTKRKIKFRIIGEKLKIVNWKEFKKYGVISEYKIKTRVKNILIGIRTLAGDQLDGWAIHRYYIAILLKSKNSGLLLDTHETESGWKAPLFQKTYREWKQELLERLRK